MWVDKYKHYAPLVIRIGLSLIFLWFGFNQVFNSSDWTGWLPEWALNTLIQPERLVLLNGLFESILGFLLLIGLFTRIVAALLTIHLWILIPIVGYNDVAIRDFGLSLAALSIFLRGPDKWCFERKT